MSYPYISMSYSRISMKSVLNFIYAEEKGEPFEAAKNTAINLYNFAIAREIIGMRADYMEFVLMVLYALTGDGDITTECQKAVNIYYNGRRMKEYPDVPSDYVNTIREATKATEAEYNSLTERTAETRRILSHSGTLIFNRKENAAVVDYIKYIQSFIPNTDPAIFYSALYAIGFMQGVRSERARRNGTPTTPSERTTVAAYQGRKHRRRCLS